MIRLKQLLIFVLLAFVFVGCASDEEKKLSHFEKRRSYFEEGQYKSAVLELKNALQIDPGYLDAWLQLAETYMKDEKETFEKMGVPFVFH